MTIIQQLELHEMEPTNRYDAIISAIDLDAVYHEISKKSCLGAPADLNYRAMIISIFV